MNSSIQISPETYRMLQRRAKEMRSTPEQVAETAIRLQLGNTVHIEQKSTPSGPQAYIRGTRVAVRHIVAFLKAGHTVEEIIQTGLPQLSPAAVYEAVAYYYDHQAKIDAELQADAPDAIRAKLQQLLTPAQYAALTGNAA